MISLITAAIGLASIICNFIATESLLSVAKELADLQNQLNSELDKGYDSDDAKVESLYQQIQVKLTQVNNELSLMQSNKGSSVSVSVPTGSTSK